MTAAVALEFARIGFLNMLAFRLRYYMGVVTYLVNVTVNYFIWSAIYANDANFAGFTFAEMLTYVAVGWVIRSMYFNNIDYELSSDILEGKVSMAMLKPVSLQASYVSRALGESVFRMALLTAPTALIVAFLFPVMPPKSAAHFAAFVVSLCGSIALVAALNFMAGSLAIKLKSIMGLLRAKYWLQELLSGLLVPLALFPAPLRAVSHWLPFEHIGYTPVMLYLGKIAWDDALQRIALQFAWAIVLFIAGHVQWNRLSRHITIQGG